MTTEKLEEALNLRTQINILQRSLDSIGSGYVVSIDNESGNSMQDTHIGLTKNNQLVALAEKYIQDVESALRDEIVSLKIQFEAL